MKDTEKIPNGNNMNDGNLVNNTNSIGKLVRNKRKKDKLTQIELAELTGVGVRFLSELENGKHSVQLDKVFLVLAGLGLKMNIK